MAAPLLSGCTILAKIAQVSTTLAVPAIRPGISYVSIRHGKTSIKNMHFCWQLRLLTKTSTSSSTMMSAQLKRLYCPFNKRSFLNLFDVRFYVGT